MTTQNTMKYLILILLFFSYQISNAQFKKADHSIKLDETTYHFNPQQNCNIVFIGNSFADRLRDYNYFETLLYKNFPERNLTIRNLGWSADEVGLRPRPLNYEDLDAQLSRQKSDIIFAFFGMNEAFKGPDSLENFKRQLKDFLQNMKGREYNGEAPPEVILVSPIAQEEKGQGFPDPSEQNNNLQLYTKAMQTVDGELQISFINLYEPSKRLMGQESEPLTTNGIHLNEAGYEKMSEHMARALGLSESSWNETPYTKDLKKVIAQKNQLFFYLNRPVNGEYSYGSRNDWPGAAPPFPAEFEELGGMVQQMDSTIWAGLNSGTINTEKANRIINSNQDEQPKRDKPTDSDAPASTDQFVLQEGYQIELLDRKSVV